MKERPIIFDAESVRAILDGRKTMTRRAVKAQGELTFLGGSGDDKSDPRMWGWRVDGNGTDEYVTLAKGDYHDSYSRCPQGQPGDTLWVRETWRAFTGDDPRIEYRAGGVFETEIAYKAGIPNTPAGVRQAENELAGVIAVPPWRSPIHMPRWASRIALKVTDVRVERLQEISNADIAAEGYPAKKGRCCGKPGCPFENVTDADLVLAGVSDGDTMFEWFSSRWDYLNAKRGYPWESNPWVWVVQFERVED